MNCSCYLILDYVKVSLLVYIIVCSAASRPVRFLIGYLQTASWTLQEILGWLMELINTSVWPLRAIAAVGEAKQLKGNHAENNTNNHQQWVIKNKHMLLFNRLDLGHTTESRSASLFLHQSWAGSMFTGFKNSKICKLLVIMISLFITEVCFTHTRVCMFSSGYLTFHM